MTQAEYAKKIGVSRQYISKLVKKGAVRFKNGKVYPDSVEAKGKRDSVNRVIIPRLGKSEGGNGTGRKKGYWDTKTDVEGFNALLKELEYHKQVGTLIRADEVSKVAFDTAHKVRGLLNILPERLCHVLAAESDSGKIHDLLEKEIRQITDELTNRFSRKSLSLGVRDGDPA